MSIVIAYDGSDCAKVAIDGLLRAGLPHRANALVVCVGEALLPTPSAPMGFLLSALASRVAGTLVQARAEADQAEEEASALAHEGSGRAHGLFPDWGVYLEPVAGAPAEAVIQRVNGVGHTRALLGGDHSSVTDEVVDRVDTRHAPTP